MFRGHRWCRKSELRKTFPIYTKSHHSCQKELIVQLEVSLRRSPFGIGRWENFRAWSTVGINCSLSNPIAKVTREGGIFFFSLLYWVSRVPRKVHFFVWLATMGAILAVENLRNRRITYISWFFMGRCSGGDVNHLLLHCKVATQSWFVALN